MCCSVDWIFHSAAGDKVEGAFVTHQRIAVIWMKHNCVDGEMEIDGEAGLVREVWVRCGDTSGTGTAVRTGNNTHRFVLACHSRNGHGRFMHGLPKYDKLKQHSSVYVPWHYAFHFDEISCPHSEVNLRVELASVASLEWSVCRQKDRYGVSKQWRQYTLWPLTIITRLEQSKSMNNLRVVSASSKAFEWRDLNVYSSLCCHLVKIVIKF